MLSQGQSIASPARNTLWLGLLVAASAVFSFATACATPFAALSTIAALTQPRKQALYFTGAVWLVNQFIGFTLLGYPWTLECLSWGVALGMTAMLSTLAARWISLRLSIHPVANIAAAFAASFVVYEGALYAFSVALGGTENFILPLQEQILAINAVALVGLFVLNRLATAIGLASAYSLRATPARA